MEDYITLSAKTLDDAITEALVQLGVTSDRLDYIVVEKGSEGFLGIGRKQAVIKARRKQEEKPVEEVVKEEPKVEEPVKEYSHARKPAREEKTEVKSAPKKEAELAKVEPQTIETCEKFIYDVMNAMGMEDVINCFSRSSLATGPKIRVPLGVLSSLIITAAFSSNLI